MMDQWEKISYIVQLIAACALFMIHSRKRANFVLRMVLCSGTLVLTSYGVNSILENQKFSVWIVLYWAAFLLVCVLLMAAAWLAILALSGYSRAEGQGCRWDLVFLGTGDWVSRPGGAGGPPGAGRGALPALDGLGAVGGLSAGQGDAGPGDRGPAAQQ